MSEISKPNGEVLKYFHLAQEAKNVYETLASYDYAADPKVITGLLDLIRRIEVLETLSASGEPAHPDDSYESLKAELDKLNAQIGKA